MTRRDQELLDRQLRGLGIQPPPTGTMILAIMAVFVAGLFLGNVRSEAREPVHFDTVETALAAPSGLEPDAYGIAITQRRAEWLSPNSATLGRASLRPSLRSRCVQRVKEISTCPYASS